MQQQLLAAMSTEHPIHLFQSFSSPSYMGMEAQGLQPASVPNTTSLMHGSLGMLACSISTAFVGGQFTDCWNSLVNNCWRALFTECSLLVLSYGNTMNLSKTR